MFILIDKISKQVISYSTTELLNEDVDKELVETDDEILLNQEFMSYPIFYKYENGDFIKVPEYESDYNNVMEQEELNRQADAQREADLLFNTVNTNLKIQTIEEQNANIIFTLAKNGIV